MAEVIVQVCEAGSRSPLIDTGGCSPRLRAGQRPLHAGIGRPRLPGHRHRPGARRNAGHPRECDRHRHHGRRGAHRAHRPNVGGAVCGGHVRTPSRTAQPSERDEGSRRRDRLVRLGADNAPYVRQLVVPLSASRVRQLPRGQASEVSQGWRQIVVVMRSSSWRKWPRCSGDIYACGGGETGEIAQRGHRRPHPGPKALVMHPSTAMSLTASPTMRS